MAATFNGWLVALSIVIAVLASYTALDLASRLTGARGAAAAYWLIGGAFSMGLGIWSMHFVGMLAYSLPIPLAYDLPITLASILPAVVAAALALIVVSRARVTAATLGAGAVLMGAGIVAMHYSGMAAMKMSPPIRYDPALFALSVLVAIGASLAALRLAFKTARASTPAQKLGSAAFMGLAIAGMHYLGMWAAIFDPASVCLATPRSIDAGWLAINVGGGTLLILGLTVATSMFDSALAAHHAHAVEHLRRLNEDLEQRAQGIAAGMTRELRESQDKLLKSESSLREVNARLENIIQSSPLAIYTRTREGVVTSWNPAAERMYGWTAAEAIGRPLLTVPADRREESAALRARILNGERMVDVEAPRVRRDGTPIFIRSTLAPLQDAEGRIGGYVTVVADITEQKKSEGMLRLSAKVFENASEGIMVTDADANIVAVNKAFSAITGYAAEEAIGKNPRLLQAGWQDAAFYASLWESLTRDGHWQGELWDRRKNGEAYAQWTNIAAVRDERGQVTHYVAVMSDITARKEAEQRLSYLATHDALTGLNNRALFHESLSRALARARRGDAGLAVLFLDIDNFKAINDTLGHHAGDLLLREIAARLSACVRDSDAVARQGGDEFTVLLEDVTSADDVAHIAQKLLEALAPPFQIAQQEIFVTASIGIDMFPEDGEGADDLLKNADAAMYHAKDQGRNNYQFYSAELNAAAARRLAMERDLRRAIDRREFALRYQAQVDLRTRRIVGVEALLRWQHPQRGTIDPAEFVPLAEASGLIGTIGEWVLQAACAQNRAWQQDGLPAIPVAVNVSARQFQSDIVATVRRVLETTRLEPRHLELELTESLLMKNVDATASALDRLSALGVQFSIDDFGTGHSSLNYLKRFPVDRLKIDRSFVRDIATDPDDAAIVKAIVSLGHSLGLRVLAEGAETEAQLAFLVREGCDEAQGYLLSPPVAAEEFERLLRDPACFAPRAAQARAPKRRAQRNSAARARS